MDGLNGKYTWYLMVVFLLGLSGLWGCPKNAEMSAASEPQREEASVSDQAQAEQNQAAKSVEEEARERAAAAESAGLQPVYFDFDQYYIRDEAKVIMKANAEWLKAHPQSRIRIEGNCDEKGTIEYNQTLGQRRAQSAKKYLTDLGISAGRISLISYGKEKPACTESTEGCWQKNRKDDFVILSE